MNQCLRMVVASLATGILATAALADPLPKGLSDAYKSVNAAVAKLDFKAFSSHFHPDFVLIDPKGQETKRADFMSMIKPMFEGHASAKANTKIMSVHVLGDYAEVKFVMQMELTSKQGTMKLREEGTDSLVMHKGKWMLYRTVQDKFSMTGP